LTTYRSQFELYPRRLRDRLPRIGVPLVSPDPDAPLDIQAAVEQVYQEGSYALMPRSDEPCVPPLAVADRQWAAGCIAAFRAARAGLFPPGPATNGTGS
jgi:hypothetical protein